MLTKEYVTLNSLIPNEAEYVFDLTNDDDIQMILNMLLSAFLNSDTHDSFLKE